MCVVQLPVTGSGVRGAGWRITGYGLRAEVDGELSSHALEVESATLSVQLRLHPVFCLRLCKAFSRAGIRQRPQRKDMSWVVASLDHPR